MKVTGYKLKEALKMKGLELGTVSVQFDDTLFKFKGEEKTAPKEIADQTAALEKQIAILQTAQSYYNLQVVLDVNGYKMTLEQGIKMVGGAGRISKMWRTAAAGKQRDRWDRYSTMTRKADEEAAEPTVARKDALQHAITAEKFASALRSAIAVGNTKEVEVEIVDESLLA